MTKYAYIQNTEIPGLRAHSAYVIKTAEAAALNSHDVWLILSKRVVKEWNRHESVWEYYHVKKNILHLTYLSGFRFLLISFLYQLLHRYLFTLDTFWFALQAWFKARSLSIEIIQTSDAEVVTIFSLLSIFYRPQIIFDIHHYIPSWMKSFKYVNLFVSNSIGYQQDLIRLGVNPSKILVLPNGYDSELFDLPKIAHTDVVIGFIGRFATFGDEKGITSLINAITALKDTLPIKAVLIGEPQSLADKYRHQVESLGISNLVEIKSTIPPSQVPSTLKSFNCGWLVYPDTSRYRHHISPMKAIEYAAARIPIIASDLPSIRDIFSNDEVFYVDPKDLNQIIHTIKLIATDRELVINKTNLAYKKVKYLTWTKRQWTIFDKLDELLAKTTPV